VMCVPRPSPRTPKYKPIAAFDRTVLPNTELAQALSQKRPLRRIRRQSKGT
jgi:hypothetical protein